MSLKASTGTRSAFIAICAILIGSTIYVVGESVRERGSSRETTREASQAQTAPPEIAQEAGVFRLSRNALGIATQPASPEKDRDLATFYRRRAYPGAPPIIPHAVKADMDRGKAACLSCHEGGGLVSEFKAFAPVTPHPKLVSCRQCHVSAAGQSLFRETLWQSVSPLELKRAALPGSPPQIPHDLHMRENCLACHGGIGAVKEIRVTHPERVNCRQCHAALQEDTLWVSSPGKDTKKQ